MSDLARTLLSEELRALHGARRSGVLTVSRAGVTKGVFLRSGRIVFASSTLEKDKLGENLIRLGRISRAEFSAAYDAARGQRERLGTALVDAGLLSEEELGRAVAHQVQKIVLSLFTWTTGDTQFHEAPDPIPADLALDLSTHRLLFEGARIFPDVERLEAALGGLERRVRTAPRAPFDTTRFAFSPAEVAVLDDAGKEMRVSDVLARPMPRPLLVRAAYALLVGGLIDDVSLDTEGFVEQETGTFRVAVSAAPEPPAADGHERVLALFEAMPRATHYEVLGVPSSAGESEIAAAYTRLTEEQDRDWRELAGDVRLSAMIDALRLRRRDAYEVLADRASREAYDRSLCAPVTTAARPAGDEGHTRAARLARGAQALVLRGDDSAAIPLLLESVDLSPGDFASRRLLALALAQHPSLYRTAERHFITALELEPQDLDLRYRLGLYYRRLGLTARARAQMEVVLAAHPGHDGARRELRSLRG